MAQSFIISSHVYYNLATPWGDVNFNTWEAGHHMERHAHNYLQTIHVLEGELDVDWGDGYRKLKPADVHLLPPNRHHQLRTKTGLRQFGINFSPAHDERGILGNLLSVCTAPTVTTLSFRKIWETAIADGNSGALGRIKQLHTLEEYTICLIEALMPKQDKSMAGKLIAYITGAAAASFSVDEAAASLAVSRATLQRLCQRYFGCGVSHLYERLRLEKATDMLAQGDRSVGDIAEECGYADIFGFSRAFKRTRGVSPQAFRKRTNARKM